MCNVKIRGALLAVLLFMSAAHPAWAECYDILGCSDRAFYSAHMDYLASRSSGPTCDFLFLMRNSIYEEHGYCFRTARARAVLSNEGCRTTDVDVLGLNTFERANVKAIARAEALKGCPRS